MSRNINSNYIQCFSDLNFITKITKIERTCTQKRLNASVQLTYANNVSLSPHYAVYLVIFQSHWDSFPPRKRNKSGMDQYHQLVICNSSGCCCCCRFQLPPKTINVCADGGGSGGGGWFWNPSISERCFCYHYLNIELEPVFCSSRSMLPLGMTNNKKVHHWKMNEIIVRVTLVGRTGERRKFFIFTFWLYLVIHVRLWEINLFVVVVVGFLCQWVYLHERLRLLIAKSKTLEFR